MTFLEKQAAPGVGDKVMHAGLRGEIGAIYPSSKGLCVVGHYLEGDHGGGWDAGYFCCPYHEVEPVGMAA